jgi:hypothetical protein
MFTESETIYQHHKVVSNTSLRHWIFLSVIALILFLVNSFVGLHAKEVKPQSEPIALLDQIWQPLPPLKRVLSKQDQKYAEATLIQWLQTYLRNEYEVIDQGFFWEKKGFSTWAAIGTGYAAPISGEGSKWRGVEIDEAWYNPASDPIRMWKVNVNGEDCYFAVVMTNQPVPGTRGRPLVGRFKLKKIIE